MDQFIAAPVVLGGFFAFVGMLEGGGVEDVKEKVQSVSWGGEGGEEGVSSEGRGGALIECAILRGN